MITMKPLAAWEGREGEEMGGEGRREGRNRRRRRKEEKGRGYMMKRLRNVFRELQKKQQPPGIEPGPPT